MKKVLAILALALLASGAYAGPMTDLLWDTIAKHGSLNYAHSFKTGKDSASGIVGAVDVNLKQWDIGSQASLTVFGGVNVAFTTQQVAGAADDHDLSLGIGGGLKLLPNTKAFTLRAAAGYNPGPLKWHYELGVTIPLSL
jgi:hypothetical protein